MDATHQIGTGEHQQVVVALQTYRVVAKFFTPEIGLGKPFALNHSAKGTVEHEDAAGKKGSQHKSTTKN